MANGVNVAYKFPKQLIDEKEKDQNWCEENIDAIAQYLAYNDGPYMRSRYKDIRNYQYYNGHFNTKDYEYITETYGLPYPARLVNYPIISPKIDLLVGEEIRRPIDYKVSTVNKAAVQRKEDFKVSIIMNKLLEDINKQIESKLNMEVDMDNKEFPIPDDIDVFMKYSYKEMVEETAQDCLNYLYNQYNYKDLFRYGFRDFLITGKEFYKIDIRNGDPHVRRVDPRTIVYDIGTNSEYLDDATWVGEERWMSVNEILDEYRASLTKENIIRLEELRNIASASDADYYNNPFKWVDYDIYNGVKVRVLSCEWKSIRELKFKVSENKYNPDQPFLKLLPEKYKPRKGDNIEVRYVDDVWEGTKMGGEILVNCRRRPNQVRSVDDAGTTPLSYTGALRNNISGETVSMVDLMKHVQQLYNIVMYHIELAMARAGGKAVVYDVSQMPTNIGMDMQTVMYHIKNDGIIPINSKDEGGQAASFNQFQQVDFTLSNSVQQLINLKIMLEDVAGQISGVSRQREVAVGQYEYVGNVQRSVVQSATVTESWFYQHNQLKKRVMERVINLVKLAWAGGKKAGYVLGDGGYNFLNVLPDVSMNDYGIYVGDDGKDSALQQVIGQLAQSAIQGGQITLLDAIKVMKAESFTEAEHILEKGIGAIQEQNQQRQQEMMAQQQQQASVMQGQKEFELQKEQIKIDGKLQQTKMQTESQERIADMKSSDSRSIADMKERTALDRKILDADIKDKELKNNPIQKGRK